MSFSTQTLAMASNSSLLYTMPVGLEGLLRIRALVLGVMAAESCSAVILKPADSSAVTMTGTPPTILMSSR